MWEREERKEQEEPSHPFFTLEGVVLAAHCMPGSMPALPSFSLHSTLALQTLQLRHPPPAARLRRVIAWEPVPYFASFLRYGLLRNNFTDRVQVRPRCFCRGPS